MSHLTPDELIDAVEDIIAPARDAHLQSCNVCQAEVSKLTAVLREAQTTEIPEPSPLFWDRFSDRVRDAIAAEPPARPAWWRWSVLAPLSGFALLIFALISALPPPQAPPPLQTATSLTEPDPTTAADDAWAVVSDLLGDVDLDTAQEAGIAATPGSADRAVLALTDAEQQELLRLLQQELKGSGG